MAKSKRPPPPTTEPRRRQRTYSRVALVLAAAFGAYYWYSHKDDARAATAYGARIACSCRHVDGRELDQCREDFLPEMRLVRLSEDNDDKSVSAWLPFFGSDTARFRKETGCTLDSWVN